MAWLTVGHVHNEEFRSYFFDSSAFLQELWDHFVGLWLSYDKLFTVVGVTKDVCIDELLALI